MQMQKRHITHKKGSSTKLDWGTKMVSKGKSPLLNETYLINATFIHLCNVLPHRRGERMVRTTPPTMGEKLLILICPSEQRELCDP